MTTQPDATRRGRRQRAALELLTIPAAAERLRCSDMHIYRLVGGGELRAVDIAGPGSRRSKTRIRTDDLEAYIERMTRALPCTRTGHSATRPRQEFGGYGDKGEDAPPAA